MRTCAWPLAGPARALARVALASLVACSSVGDGLSDAGAHRDAASDLGARADVPPRADGSTPDAAGGACAALASCAACSSVDGCGWCTTSMRCLAGSATGASDGACVGAAWDFTGDLCDMSMGVPDAGGPPPRDSGSTGPCVPTVARGGEDTDALCSNGLDDDCNGYADCNDFNCSRNPGVSVCGGGGARDAVHGGCVATVARGGEDTNALCANGLDDDCNGFTDCDDFACSRTASVTVCADGGAARDAGGGYDAGGPYDAGAAGPIGPTGGTVGLLHFAVFGDVRPAANNSTTYPTAIVGGIMANLRELSAQFAVASGDYMFATDSAVVTSNVSSLLGAEAMYGGYIFHGMGNHECTGATASNCPNANETPNAVAYMSRLNTGHATPYFDWVIHTAMGDAHFISTAPNAWSSAQQTWLRAALATPARYTFVLAHEPPSGTTGPGSAAIESAVSAAPGVTLRLYGHTHEYRHITGNEVIDGNAGAPLGGTGGGGDYYGFGVVDQRPDGNIVFTAYQTGAPPTVSDSFVVTPTGTITR